MALSKISLCAVALEILKSDKVSLCRWSADLLCPDILTYLEGNSLEVIGAYEGKLTLYESR